MVAACCFGCSPKEIAEEGCTGKPFNPSNGILVCNEGNFTFGNASVSFVSNNGTVTNEIYAQANCLPLGDVLQSAARIKNKLWLVVNNSGKIAVCNANTLQQEAEITGLTSPRYVQPINDTLAAVSDLYNTALTLVHTANYSVVGTIALGTSSEPLVRVQNALYTSAWSQDSTLHKIDLNTFSLVSSVVVGAQPVDLAVDQQGTLWVLCQGSATSRACLVQVNPESMEIMQRISFKNPAASASSLVYHAPSNQLIFIANSHPADAELAGGVFALHTDSTRIPSQPLIANNGRLFYELHYDTNTNSLWVSDAKDYLQQGSVCQYALLGNSVSTCQEVGIIPGYMLSL